MIELSNATKKFGRTTAVNNVSFTVKKGEIVGFLGLNAAGKTTTMRMITGFFPPTEGDIKVAGIDIVKEPMAAKEKTGYMPENVPLYREMDVSSYLDFIADIKGVPKEKKKGYMNKAMEEAGISEVRGKIIGKLSKGYRQRVGIAQAILNDPPVLILDEPTVGLDPRQIIEIRGLIKEMKGSRTMILSSHILPEVSMTCDRVVIIHNGRIIASEGVSKPTALNVRVEAPKAKFISEIKKVKGVKSVSEGRETDEKVFSYNVEADDTDAASSGILGRITKNKWRLYDFRRQQMALEDTFLNLVAKEDA